jgi:ribonuclease HI
MTTPDEPFRTAVIHADESCLRNGADGPNPGGAGSLIEVRSGDRIARRDVSIASADTTNNRMALGGAIATFEILSASSRQFRIAFVSDSQYLVKGMNEWVAGWQARGWRRKGGEVENLELWKRLVSVSRVHDTTWLWVRGHAGHPKNEYADHLAVRAAGTQIASGGAVPSDFSTWLSRERERGRYTDYDPNEAFADLEANLLSPL